RLTRAEYEPFIEPYVAQTVRLCRDLLRRTELTPAAIGQIVLVGGPTMTPMIRASLYHAFGIGLNTRLDPMTVVAQGAAIFASSQPFPDAQQRRTSGRILV